jgi:ribose transport system substrate-binding protein
MSAKRWGTLALVATCSLTAVACGGSSDKNSSAPAASVARKPVNIAFFGYAAANAYTQYALRGAQKAAREQGGKLTFFDGKLSGSVQANQMSDAIQSGRYQTFFVLANNAQNLVRPIQQAGKKGIAVVVAANPFGPDPKKLTPQVPGISTFIGYTAVDSARKQVTMIKQACAAKKVSGRPCKVAVMVGVRFIPFDATILGSIKAQLKGSDYQVTVAPDGQYSRAGGAAATSQLLQRDRTIDVLVAGTADQMAAGAVQAIGKAGLKPGKDVMVIGYGATRTAVKGIRAGTWFGSYVLLPVKMSELGVRYGMAMARKQRYPRAVDMSKMSPIPDAIVTRETLRRYPGFTGEWDG